MKYNYSISRFGEDVHSLVASGDDEFEKIVSSDIDFNRGGTFDVYVTRVEGGAYAGRFSFQFIRGTYHASYI